MPTAFVEICASGAVCIITQNVMRIVSQQVIIGALKEGT
jgi:hypothetical protein